jgi:nucleoside-diphosphate-sugar epimerase
VNLDALTYAGNPANLDDVQGHPGYTFIHGDVCDRALVEEIMRSGIEAVVHLAAESHVDRSILDASAFVRTNVLGMQTLLDAACKFRLCRFLQVSTDEVYGSLGAEGSFTEESPLAPNSPYAASKAGADLLVRAFVQTHGLPAIITRASNTYGPYRTYSTEAVLRRHKGQSRPAALPFVHLDLAICCEIGPSKGLFSFKLARKYRFRQIAEIVWWTHQGAKSFLRKGIALMACYRTFSAVGPL